MTPWLCPHARTSLESCPECGRRVTLWTWERIRPRRQIVITCRGEETRIVEVDPGEVVMLKTGEEVSRVA
jgi:hypothetical protein